jgi:hypothetical protein
MNINKNNSYYDEKNMIYSLEYFHLLSQKGFNYELPERTLHIINKISAQVGAPSYIKTPIFKKKHNSNEISYSVQGQRQGHGQDQRQYYGERNNVEKLQKYENRYESKNDNTSNINNYDRYRDNKEYIKTTHNKHNRNKKKNPKPLSDAEWETLRTFEKTKIVKNEEGIQKDINKIRTEMNKLTKDNYEDIKIEVMDKLEILIEELGQIDEEVGTGTDDTDIDKNKYENYKNDSLCEVGKAIFNLSASNGFYAELYAKLYGELVKKFKVMKSVLDKNKEEFTELFEKFEHVNPDDDYEKFCEINEYNEKRRSIVKFMAYLMKYYCISLATTYTYIYKLMKIFIENMDIDEKEVICEEVSELIYIILSVVNQELYDYEIYDSDCEDENIDIESIFEENINDLDNCNDINNDNINSESNISKIKELYMHNIYKVIKVLSEKKARSYKSLTNKSIFKMMDIIELNEE